MLTPQEIKEKKFAKAVFGGYDMTEVDDFLDSVLSDYSTLYKESVVLKGKLKVLVETVEEYRAVDASMRKALLAAQKMASEMTEEAKQKSTEMLSKVETEASERIAAIDAEIKTEEARLEAARRETGSFIDGMIAFCRRQIDAYQSIDPLPAKTARETHVEETANDIAHSVVSLFREETPPLPVPESPAPEQPAPAYLSDSDADAFFAVSENIGSFSDDFPVEAPGPGPGFPPVSDVAPTPENPRSIHLGGMNIQVFEAKFSGDGEESDEDVSF